MAARNPLVLVSGMPSEMPAGDTLPASAGGTGDTGTAWTTYTPTVAAGAGAFTTVSATGRYKVIGKTVFVMVTVTITTNGSASSYFNVSLPFTSINSIQHLSGNENQVAGFMVIGSVIPSSQTLQVQKYDASYPGGSGYRITLQGVYEAA